jgi:hypothetical protein
MLAYEDGAISILDKEFNDVDEYIKHFDKFR